MMVSIKRERGVKLFFQQKNVLRRFYFSQFFSAKHFFDGKHKKGERGVKLLSGKQSFLKEDFVLLKLFQQSIIFY